ncbi:hypothetical protein UCRNP2_5831 [Neofusicoccum parvum UCRNP2]|uniref:Uncharacterized protein n=1 Tax=Botryosphaeria parva (strain UCR-NP2) TaxID=1287680 RepID=R1GGN7_BOTPV|nr:hypothetical protein UCRNP2_5831 [Neofusicoccum parvum UCRNP2]
MASYHVGPPSNPHPLSPSLADLKLIAHPIPPTLLPHLSLTTSSSLARLFLDFEYRDLSATDYAIPDIHPAQRAWLAAHLRALNAARRESGVRLVAHWQRLVREGVEDGEGVPGGREEELRRLDWVAREVYGRYLPDYPDDYGAGNMVSVTDKYSIAAYSSSGPDRTVTAQNTAGQILNYPETPETKPTEQFLGSQNATATSTTVDHSSTTPAPAPQLLDYPPIFSTDAESTHATTQQNIAAPSTLNTNNSPHIPANASPNFPEDYINSSDGQQPTITPDEHSAVATTASPNTPQNTATHMPIPPSSAATDTPSGGTGSTTPQPGPLPSADNTQPGAAPAPSKLPPATSPADPPAPHPPQIQVNSQDLAVSQLDGAFDVSDEVLDALFNGVLEGP